MKMLHRLNYRSRRAAPALLLASEPARAAEKAAEQAAEKIEDYRAHDAEMNKAKVKASLDHLDAVIDLLRAKIEAVTDPIRKDELKARFEALTDRRAELNSEFRKARYDALAADVKAEWNKLVH